MPRSAASVLILAAFLLFAQHAHAWNYSLTVKRDDRRVIDLGVFGFNDNGRMHFNIESFSLEEKEAHAVQSEKVGFTLDLVDTALSARQEKNYAKGEGARHHICFITDPTTRPKTRFVMPLEDYLSPNGLQGANASFAVQVPGLYALFYYNCKQLDAKKSDKNIHTSFKVRVQQYNLLGDGGSGGPSYLGIGDNNLPAMYLFFAIFFIIGLVAWHRVLSDAPRQHVHKIHYGMYALMFLKCLTLVLDAYMLHHRKQTGAMKGFIDYLFYTFQTLKGIALFTIILLLGTGWSVLKPFLSERDKKVLLCILPLQIIVNIALGVLEETSEGNPQWMRWREALRIFDLVCCCAVILPVVWSIQSLKSAAGSDGKARRNLLRLRQFRTFYIAVVAFIYFTRIVVALVDNNLPYHLTWVSHFLYESAALLFYTYAGVRFRPQDPESMFTDIPDDELDSEVAGEEGEDGQVGKDRQELGDEIVLGDEKDTGARKA